MLGELGLLPPSSQRGVPIAISADDMVRVRAAFADLIGFDDLVEFLGVSRDAMKRLVAAGTLKPLEFRYDEKERYPLYSKREAAALLQAVVGGADILADVPPSCKFLTRVSQQMRLGSLDVLIDAVRDGRLRIRECVGRPLLGSVVVGIDDIETYKASVLAVSLSLGGAAAAIAMDPVTMSSAIDAGLLPSADSPGGRRRVTRDALDRFRDRYVTTSWLELATRRRP